MSGGPGPFRTVLLVGFMGSGKTTVGRRTADLLGWEFVDVDDRVEARSGLAVEEIFSEQGEEAFRTLEAEEARRALSVPERVVAPGGGWAAHQGRMEALDADVLSVWLRVDPRTAVERAREERRPRPLLDVPDPVDRSRSLLAVREPFYRRARLHLDTAGRSPERLARAIVEELRTGGDPARR